METTGFSFRNPIKTKLTFEAKILIIITEAEEFLTDDGKVRFLK